MQTGRSIAHSQQYTTAHNNNNNNFKQSSQHGPRARQKAPRRGRAFGTHTSARPDPGRALFENTGGTRTSHRHNMIVSPQLGSGRQSCALTSRSAASGAPRMPTPQLALHRTRLHPPHRTSSQSHPGQTPQSVSGPRRPRSHSHAVSCPPLLLPGSHAQAAPSPPASIKTIAVSTFPTPSCTAVHSLSTSLERPQTAQPHWPGPRPFRPPPHLPRSPTPPRAVPAAASTQPASPRSPLPRASHHAPE